METQAIARFDVLPDYRRGFLFSWRMAGGFNERRPWRFRVQSGKTPDGEWSDVSPWLEDVLAWRSDGPVRVGKSDVLFFRLVVETGDGRHEGRAVSPYGDLSRTEFLMASDIMRREALHMSRMAGVECELWHRSPDGPSCPHCLDPITGHSRDGNCRFCLGTGRFPPYRGPSHVWCSFSEDSQHSVGEGPDGAGTYEDRKFSVRMVGTVPAGKNDVLRDPRTGKMHYVNQSQVVAELRRVPLVRTLQVSEAAVTDPVYGIGGVHAGS